MMELKEIFDLLFSEGVHPHLFAQGSETFKRNIRFKSYGVDCWINWYTNLAYLSIGTPYTCSIPFTRVEVDTTWPYCVRGLRFIDENNNSYIVLATKMLQWQEDKLQESKK